MKKKFDFKTILASVCLIAGFVCIILSNYKKILINIGLIVLGVAIFLFLLLFSSKKLNDMKLAEEILQDETASEQEIDMAAKIYRKSKSSNFKIKLCFTVFAVALIICGFIV